jgi:phosphinothricin acetyltransferase
MNVRPALESDLPGILEIYNEAVRNTTATYDYETQSLADRRAWFAAHRQDDYSVLVAEEDGSVAGWSALNRYRDRKGYQYTAESSVYVAAAKRGQGVGRALMVPLLHAAEVRGLRAILAGIDAENEASLRLHASLGFERVAHLRRVGFKFGRWLDVIYMERLLPSPVGLPADSNCTVTPAKTGDSA